MNNNFYINLGHNIKKRREELNLTQQQLADIVGVGLNHIGKIEIAFSKPSLDLLINISNALKLTLSELTNFNNRN